MSSPTPVCLITGGSSGIGLATARRFACGGHHVVICGRDWQRLQTARKSITAQAPAAEVEAVVADLGDPAAPDRVARHCQQTLGRVDVLVNNAAIASVAPVDQISDELIDQMIDVNVRGVYRMTRAVWPTMQQQQHGVIVNISSLAALDPFPGFSLYGATKAWLELLTSALAGEGREHGIRVYGVRPGVVETPLLRGLFPEFPAEQTVSAEHVADMVWLVCQNEMVHSSGQIIQLTRQ